MREGVSSLRDRLQRFEDVDGSIRNALVHAERAANDLRQAANREAADVKQSARRDVTLTVREAQSRSHQMIADSSVRIERVQESSEALLEAERSFGNDFRHLLKTNLDMMEKKEAPAPNFEASLCQRLDTESTAVVHETVAHEEARIPEGASAGEGETPDTRATGTLQKPPVSEPEAVGKVEREVQSLAEESSSHGFFDRGEPSQDRGRSRIYRANLVLRRYE